MYGTGIDIKMEASICRIIRKYLDEKQIDENYRTACALISSKGQIYDPKFKMDEIVKECRKMALKQIPKEEFTKLQIIHIRQKWEIEKW